MRTNERWTCGGSWIAFNLVGISLCVDVGTSRVNRYRLGPMRGGLCGWSEGEEISLNRRLYDENHMHDEYEGLDYKYKDDRLTCTNRDIHIFIWFVIHVHLTYYQCICVHLCFICTSVCTIWTLWVFLWIIWTWFSCDKILKLQWSCNRNLFSIIVCGKYYLQDVV